MADQLATLSMLAIRWNVSLEGLRKRLERRPHLRQLGTLLGSGRVYTAAEAETLRQAIGQPAGMKAAAAAN